VELGETPTKEPVVSSWAPVDLHVKLTRVSCDIAPPLREETRSSLVIKYIEWLRIATCGKASE